MPSATAVRTNKYSPSIPNRSTSASSWGYNTNSFWSRVTNPGLRPRGGDDVYTQVTDRFLAENGKSNKPFRLSSTGAITPNQTAGGVADPRIKRGFIRRSAPDSGDAISNTSLNFMYNPTDIVRDYVSYMDQAALDPFNTLYGSGNLVAPPSFVNFSFQLIFDRQQELVNGDLSDGVLHDFKYFDMVVRNVPVQNSSSNVPDNGVMMVNPKDITVVFSPELTVQGRPTNARVAFTKFDSKMTPTRMVVSLTMIITYFGPLREYFGLDTNQEIADYEATIPYSTIYDEEYTLADVEAAQKIWREQKEARFLESLQGTQEIPYSTLALSGGVGGAYGQAGGAAGIASGVGGEVRTAALQAAIARATAATSYSQQARTGPNSYDCSGLTCKAYEDVGALGVLSGGRITTVAGIVDHQISTGWTQSSQVPGGSVASLQQNLQPGDLMARSSGHSGSNGGGNHILFFAGWTDGSKNQFTSVEARGRSASPQVGTYTRSISKMTGYNYIIRPNAAGSLSTGATFV